MPSNDQTYDTSWPAASLAGMVSADPVRRVATHVDGPTLHEREPAFGRGIASVDRAPTCNGRSNPTSAAAGPGRRWFRALGSVACNAAMLLLQGCGGGDAPAEVASGGTDTSGSTPTNTSTANTTAGTPVADPAASGTTPADGTQGSGTATLDNSFLAPGDQVKTSKATPKVFVRALGRRAMIIVMYQPGETASQQLMSEVDRAVRGRPDVLVLKYAPADYAAFGDLADQLDLFDIPSLAIVDRSGKLQNMRTRYWPSNLIARSLDIARKAAPAKVSPADAPADNGVDSMEQATSAASVEPTTPGV